MPAAISSTTDYFLDEALAARFDLLIHLAQHGPNLQLIIGADGSGKSTLIHLLEQSLPLESAVTQISCHPLISSVELMRQLATAWRLATDNLNQEEIGHRLEGYIQALTARHQAITLLVDDAHQLPRETLVYLLRFTANRSEVRLLLFGEESLEQMVAASADRASATGSLQVTIIEPLNDEQAANFISHLLSQKGWSAEPPLSRADHRRLLSQGAGNPGRLTDLLDLELERITQAATRGRIILGGALRPMILGVVVIVLGALLFYQQEVNQFFGTESAPAVGANQQTKSISIALPDHSAADVSNSAVPRENIAAASVAIPTREPATELPNPKSMTSAQLPPTASVMEARSQHPHAANQSDKAGLKGENWLLAQPGSAYTIQLLGAKDRPRMLAFATAHNIASDAAVVAYKRRGDLWYVLVYGLYSDKSSARNAINILPTELRLTKPWVRSIADIQQSISTPN